MRCVKCNKDITNAMYKVSYMDKGICWLCYKRIPTKERIQAVKGSEKQV